VLDAESDTATLGKTAGKDARMDKPTYVSALGLAAAKALARELREEAMQAVNPFGKRALRLKQLADFIVMREF
jgi:farnesyl diphosphate synthase